MQSARTRLPRRTLITGCQMSHCTVVLYAYILPSFDELIGSYIGAESYLLRDRIILKARGYAKSKINDIMEQVDEAISKNKIVNYSKPKIFGVDE